MIDHLHGDATRRGFVKGAGNVTVQGVPSFLVDLGLECCLERLVWIINPNQNPSQPGMIIYFWGPDLESWKCIYHLKIRQQLKRDHLAAALKK